MKKVFILAILTLFLTGCYDYQELNNRAIITGIALDYIDEEIVLNYEIMSTKKSDAKEQEEGKSYYIEGSGKTISEAFQKANLKLSKEPTLFHLKVLILSEDIAKEKISDILDYLIRDPEIYNIFHPVLAKEIEAREILKTTNKENPVSSEMIENMLENNKASNTITTDVNFENFLSQTIDSKTDSYLNVISKSEDTLALAGIAVFKDDKLRTILGIEEAATFNTLNNQSPNYYLKTTCPNNPAKYISINLYENDKTEIEFQDQKIIFKSDLEGSVVEDNCNIDFRNPQSYQEVDTLFIDIIKKKFEDVYKILQENQTDILKIQSTYYKMNRHNLENWYQYNVEFEINLKVNKNGLIFEVTEHE